MNKFGFSSRLVHESVTRRVSGGLSSYIHLVPLPYVPCNTKTSVCICLLQHELDDARLHEVPHFDEPEAGATTENTSITSESILHADEGNMPHPSAIISGKVRSFALQVISKAMSMLNVLFFPEPKLGSMGSGASQSLDCQIHGVRRLQRRYSQCQHPAARAT